MRHLARGARWIAANRVLGPSETVHALRVIGKRARAILKLCRQTPAVENTRGWENDIRQGMRHLGSTRDQDVEAALLRRYSSSPWNQERQAVAEEATMPLVDAIERAAAGIAATDWSGDPASWIRAGLRTSHRKARRGWKRECRRPSPSHLHEWRTACKTLCYQLEALGLRQPVVPRNTLRRLRSIGKTLGEAHDLDLLANNRGEHLSGKEKRAVDKAYAKKRRKALRLAAKFFSKKTLPLKAPARPGPNPCHGPVPISTPSPAPAPRPNPTHESPSPRPDLPRPRG